ncbi:hypothetical protein K3495_g12194 [Podosphaera aphanis]|nr:hypothetical protein K3495_g12194 [Podosphaera aphanis]
MSPRNDHEEKKVQETLQLLQKNPSMKVAAACMKTHAIPSRVYRRRKGIPDAASKGGHNKRLDLVKDNVLKDYLFMCHSMGRSANIDQIVGVGNSILLHQGQEATCNRRWAKRWLK